MMTNRAVFNTSEDLEYWKKRAQEMQERSEMLEQELQEFQENSVSLKKELEMSYEKCKKQSRELQSENVKLMASHHLLKIRLNEYVQACGILHMRLETALSENDKLAVSVRKLEQENDKMGQQIREAEQSGKEREEQLDDLIEKLALTETEQIHNTEGYKILVQRLKEENSELKQQITVDLTQQKKRNCIVKSIELATSFKFSRCNNSFDDVSLATVADLKLMSMNELLKYAHLVTQRFEALEIDQQRSKAAEQTMSAKYNSAVEKIAFLETERVKSIHDTTPTDRELTVKPEVQLRACLHRQAPLSKRRSKSMDKTRSSLRLTQGQPEAKLLENSPVNVADNVEECVNEDERRQQNFSGFIKRLRHGKAPGWLRRRN